MQTRHHISEENWTPPKTFEEYFAQYPDWHVKWLNKRYPLYTNEDFQDVAQDILTETLRKQRVEKYVPSPDLVNRPGLFFHYMGMCFNRDLATILRERQSDKRRANRDALSIDVTTAPDVLLMNGFEDQDISSSSVYKHRTKQEGLRAYNSARLSQFLAFVNKHRPDLIRILDAMESGDDLGISRQNWFLIRNKLKILVRHFEAGTIPRNSAWKK